MALAKPTRWDVVWCFFPYRGLISQERHPVLVLRIYKNYTQDIKFLVVAGGSTIRDIAPAKSDFYVLKNDKFFEKCFYWQEALTNDTKFHFDFNNIMLLPYTIKFFKEIPQHKDGHNIISPIIGSIPLGNSKYPELTDRFLLAVDSSEYELKLQNIAEEIKIDPEFHIPKK